MDLFPVTLLNFEGAFNLPLWVAQERNLFEKHGLKVATEYTKGSVDMVKRLSEGSAQIALTSVDNVLAYAGGQGESERHSELDLIAFMGGDHGLLSLVAKREFKSVGQLRGKDLSVDAITTGFAFALREILANEGIVADEVTFVAAGGTGNRYRELIAGKHDATLVRTPFERLAQRQGFNVLATVSELFPDYLGTVGATFRSWASENRTQLIGFLLTYREALNWIFNLDNKLEASQLLQRHFASMPLEDGFAIYDSLVDRRCGLIRDMDISNEGVLQVAKIRNAHATGASSEAFRSVVELEYLAEARKSSLWHV